MRLIDADEVSAILTRLIEEQKKSHNLDEVLGLMEARTEVNNAPTIPQWINAYGMQTIDTAPVIHAHWEKADSRFHRRIMQCSNCGNFLDMEGVNCGRGSANYCPNCGAKMDPMDS